MNSTNGGRRNGPAQDLWEDWAVSTADDLASTFRRAARVPFLHQRAQRVKKGATPSEVVYAACKSSGFLLNPFSETGLENNSAKLDFTWPISMRSCGRFGPASEGATVPKSSVTTLV